MCTSGIYSSSSPTPLTIYRDAQVEVAPAMACSGAVLALAPGPARPQRRLARERSSRGLGHRGVLAGGLEEEKGWSPPAAGKKRRVRTAGRREEEEGALVAGRGEGEEGVLAAGREEEEEGALIAGRGEGEEGVLTASHTEKRRGARRRPRGGKGRVCAHDSNEYGGVELGIEGGQI